MVGQQLRRRRPGPRLRGAEAPRPAGPLPAPGTGAGGGAPAGPAGAPGPGPDPSQGWEGKGVVVVPSLPQKQVGSQLLTSSLVLFQKSCCSVLTAELSRRFGSGGEDSEPEGSDRNKA